MLELNKIHHGDCLEIMKDIPDGSIDMILADPPYGINLTPQRKTSKFKNEKIPNDDNLEWLPEVVSERICYGTELQPKYVDIILARWEQFTGQKAVKIDGN